VDASERSTADLATVSLAYGRWATAYIDMFGSADRADSEDRELIAAWSRDLPGPVLDAGCGPGQWSAFLHSRGVTVEGVDATPEFVARAARTNPDIPFRVADLREIALADESLGGVLAWFSLIHADPRDVPAVLHAFARALAPGGSLLIGFFSGERLEPFDHRVVTGWTWPMSRMTEAAEGVGLDVVSTHERLAPNGRRKNAAILARRAA
jgi:SAM-dependent methyltransferase